MGAEIFSYLEHKSMLSKYLNELYNNSNRDPDPTQNPNEKF
jgi:hypothetical protein